MPSAADYAPYQGTVKLSTRHNLSMKMPLKIVVTDITWSTPIHRGNRETANAKLYGSTHNQRCQELFFNFEITQLCKSIFYFISF